MIPTHLVSLDSSMAQSVGRILCSHFPPVVQNHLGSVGVPWACAFPQSLPQTCFKVCGETGESFDSHSRAPGPVSLWIKGLLCCHDVYPVHVFVPLQGYMMLGLQSGHLARQSVLSQKVEGRIAGLHRCLDLQHRISLIS